MFDFPIVSSDSYELNFYSYYLKDGDIFDFTNIYVLKKFNAVMILKG